MRRMVLLTVGFVISLSGGGCADLSLDIRPHFELGSQTSMQGPDGHYARATAHFKDGRYALAAEAFQAALLVGERKADALNGLAAAYDNLGRFDLAHRYYREALSLDPHSPVTLHNLGYSHLMQGELDQALTYMEKAQALDADNETIAKNLEMVARLMSQPQLATNAVEPVETTPLSEERASRSTWVQRDSGAVQTLVTAPEDQFLTYIAEVNVDPRVVGYQVRPDEDAQAAMQDQGETDLPTEDTQVLPAHPLRVEVSNGAGRRHMAARMARYLGSEDLEVAILTNDVTFTNQKSVIYFREGFESAAKRLAELLPITVPLEPLGESGRSDVRLVLGGDLLEFDLSLLRMYPNDDVQRS